MTEYELMEEISDNIRVMMRRRGINQNELAKKSGLSVPAIHRYLNAERIPTMKSILNIRYALDCEIEELIPTYEFIHL